MLLLFALLTVLYVAMLFGFWSLCRMSAMQPRPWTHSSEEKESFILVPSDSLVMESPVTLLAMQAGR